MLPWQLHDVIRSAYITVKASIYATSLGPWNAMQLETSSILKLG